MNRIAQLSDDSIITAVTPIMDNLMEGSTEIDHRRHTRDFTDRLRSQISPERLDTICRDYQARIGFFGKREVVGLFRRERSVAVVWRQWASGTSDELVAEAVFVPVGDGWQVDHAMVF